MNEIRQQFEKETGWHPSTPEDRASARYKSEYIGFLENRVETLSNPDNIDTDRPKPPGRG